MKKLFWTIIMLSLWLSTSATAQSWVVIKGEDSTEIKRVIRTNTSGQIQIDPGVPITATITGPLGTQAEATSIATTPPTDAYYMVSKTAAANAVTNPLWFQISVDGTHAVDATNPLPAGAYGYDPDGAAWTVPHTLSAIPTSLTMSYNPWVTSSAVYGYDGSVPKMLRVGASDELQVTDVANRAGEDLANDWRKAKKQETAIYTGVPTMATAVDETGGGITGDEVLASTYVQNLPNFTIAIVNAGGGSADVLSDALVFQSPTGGAGTWEPLAWTSCDSLATAGGSCSYQVSGNSYGYIKAEALCGAGDDTTVDVYLTANKN